MPVIDHPVHPKTVSNGKYGCQNRGDFESGYWAPDRIYRADGTFETTQVWISTDGLSRDCVTGKRVSDPMCGNCFRKTFKSEEL